MEKNFVLQLQNIEKSFPGVKALADVDFTLKKGEIHALIGENGAGKSTLMHVLAGIHEPEKGSIKINNRSVNIDNPYQATQYGIGVVFQELSLVTQLSIAENIFVNRQPIKKNGFIDKEKLYFKTNKLLELFKLDFSPAKKVEKLSTGDQQLIEILKAISQEPEVLILDEPTSSLSKDETKRLFNILQDLKQKEDISIIYITHRLNELFELCDRVTVLRDGRYIGTKNVSQTCEDELVTMMVGREVKNIYGQGNKEPGTQYFKVNKMNSPGKFRDITFSLKQGEILGFFGLVGAGRTELARGIFGLDPGSSGEIIMEGNRLNINNPADAIDHGIGYLTEDRKNSGLFLDFTLKQNVVSADLGRFSSGLLKFMDEQQIKEYAQGLVDKFKIVTPSINSKVRKLSGGNQQKALVANWMGINPSVLIVDEPTRGVDVGAKSDIYSYIRNLAANNVGIILLSSDLPEVLGLSDRVLVMREGQIVDEIPGDRASEENVLASAAGVSNTNQNT